MTCQLTLKCLLHWDSVSPRKSYILISTRKPRAIQRVPWPVRDESDDEEAVHTKVWSGYDTWALNDQEVPWLVEPDGEP